MPVLLALFWILSFFEILYFETHLQSEMERVGRTAALARLAEENVGKIFPAEGEAYRMLGEALYTGISGVAIDRELNRSVDGIREGVFCRFEDVSVDLLALHRTPHTVDLVVTYRVRMPLTGVQERILRSRRRIWCGDAPKEREEQGEIVFVTVSGSVYHRSRDCRHLTIRMREVPVAGLTAERNLAGAKYYACEICVRGTPTGPVYVTAEGTRYHTRSTCAALKRSVREVLLEEIRDTLPGCKACGGEQ
ncbi:MAG: hypothetical protein IJL66_00345 [Lachnospiraceae bacterium]|nr:hypothetical protein [Lachnospiraceae bacterium]